MNIPILFHKGVEYSILKDKFAILFCIIGGFHHIKVPSYVTSADGKRYKVVGISGRFLAKGLSPTIISFDQMSEIETISLYFIFIAKSIFYLPPRIKRIESTGFHIRKMQPKIVANRDNRFVSIAGKNILYNNHPLELVSYPTRKIHLHIRETVRFIGHNFINDGRNIISIIFPPSIEVIGPYFRNCNNLRFITFKGNSRLKIIEKNAFENSKIERVDFPSNLEEIGDFAFKSCRELRSVSFPKVSKLKRIGEFAFSGTAIKSFVVPASVEEIEENAFFECEKLFTFIIMDESKDYKIGKDFFECLM